MMFEQRALTCSLLHSSACESQPVQAAVSSQMRIIRDPCFPCPQDTFRVLYFEEDRAINFIKPP